MEASDELRQIMSDNTLREELGIGSHFTGPKGVMADQQFHAQQAIQRKNQNMQDYNERLGRGGLTSGWMERQIAEEKMTNVKSEKRGGVEKVIEIKVDCLVQNGNEEEMEEMFKQLEEEVEMDHHTDIHVQSRLTSSGRMMPFHLQMKHETRKIKSFGHLVEIGEDDYVNAIEGEDPETNILVHVYHPHDQNCRELNFLLAHVAKRHGYTKFIKVQAAKIGAQFSLDMYPLLLCYKNGELEQTILKVDQELRNWSVRGTCEPEDLEDYLIKMKVLSE